MEQQSRASSRFAQPSVVLALGIVLVVASVSVAWWMAAHAPKPVFDEDVADVASSTDTLETAESTDVSSEMHDEVRQVANEQAGERLPVGDTTAQVSEGTLSSQGIMIELDAEVSLFELADARGSTTGMRMFAFCSAVSPISAMREEQCSEWGFDDCADVTEEIVSELCSGLYDVHEEVPNSGKYSFGESRKIHVMPYAVLSPYRVTFETDAFVYQTLTVGGLYAESVLSRLSFPMGTSSRATFAIEVVEGYLDVRQVHLDLFGDNERVYVLSHKGIDMDTKCTILGELLARSSMPDDVRISLARDIERLRAYAKQQDASVRAAIASKLSTYSDDEAGEYVNVLRSMLDEVTVRVNP